MTDIEATRIGMPAILRRSKTTVEDLPDDVLMEIFVHCLPDDRLRGEPQPNTKIAPMLLCQVCSRWRALALALSALWTHLYFSVHLEPDRLEYSLISRTPAKLVRDLEFLRWWSGNGGSLPPFLHITIIKNNTPRHESIKMLDVDEKTEVIIEDTIDFVAEYMNSAQYISTDELHKYLMLTAAEGDAPLLTFPNLHTLSAKYIRIDDSDDENRKPINFFTECIDPILEVPTLQHLHLRYAELVQLHPYTFAKWSNLTHLHLHLHGFVRTAAWFGLLQSLSNLQCGRFDFLFDIYRVRPPTPTILPSLAFLYIHINNDGVSNRIAVLLENVHMPVLDELILHQNIGWTSARIKSDLYPVLQLTPKLTFLSLSDYIPSFITPADAEITPITNYVPNLTTIYIVWNAFPENEGNESTVPEQFLDHLFSPNNWLHLSSRNNPVQKVFVEINYYLEDSEDSELEFERQDDWIEKKQDIVRRSVSKGIQKHVAEARDVVFQVKINDGDGIGISEARMADELALF